MIEVEQRLGRSGASPANSQIYYRVCGEAFEDAFDNVLMIEGEVEVPRAWPPVGHLDERLAYPMLVTFGDIDDPTSVERVDTDDLAARFGMGYALERITVQITDDPVTTGIEARLGGWANHLIAN